MRDPDQFDAFYKAARQRLLVQCYALTGDLRSARGAVRAAFVAAWHHWRKVSRLSDPEDWVRPFAWAHAQRSHTARIWHRDKDLAPGLRATLDALAKLSANQRKVLLLSLLTEGSPTEVAREAGLPEADAARQLAIAVADFAHLRDVEPSDIRANLLALEGRTGESRFPRASIVRRAGAARRRTHTAVGVAASLAALLVAGTLAGQADAPEPGLESAGAGSDQERDQRAPDPRRLRTEDMLTAAQVATLAPGRTLGRTNTNDGTVGDGINVICQRERFADPEGVGALVRTFEAAGQPRMSAIQTVELSETEAAAAAAYRRTIGWYAGCRDARVQLLSTRAVAGAGDEGTLLVLRSWSRPVTTYAIGISRTGSLTSSVVRRVADDRAVKPGPTLRVMSLAVAALCDHPRAGACARPTASRPVSPPPAEEAPGMLQVVDLPPIPRVNQPWVATAPVRPRNLNPAATTCDRADFSGRTVAQSATRSFLIPQRNLPSRFGVSQTLGRFPDARAAGSLVALVRKRMAECEDRDLTSTVEVLHERSQGPVEMTTWHLATEISETRTVDFYMAVIRRGDAVIQLGFTPVRGADMAPGAFQDLCDRALERLASLPRAPA